MKRKRIFSTNSDFDKVYYDLHNHITRKLDKALSLKDFSDRKIILIKLFSELLETIQEKYRKKFNVLESMKLNHFFEIIGSYEDVPEELMINFQKYETELSSFENYQNIYSMLNYKRIFHKSVQTKSRVNTFLKGCNRLFWSDITNNTKKFASIYLHVRNHVIRTKMEVPICKDVISLVLKYFLYYSNASALKNSESLIKKIVLLNTHLNKKILVDIFFKETVIIVDSIDRKSPVLVRIIRLLRTQKPLIRHLSAKVSNRFKYTLYVLTRPLNTTSDIRGNSQETLDILYPYGKYPRFVLNQITRCFYQVDWPLSFMAWAISIPKQTFKWTLSWFSNVPLVGKMFSKKKENSFLKDSSDEDDFEMMYLY